MWGGHSCPPFLRLILMWVRVVTVAPETCNRNVQIKGGGQECRPTLLFLARVLRTRSGLGEIAIRGFQQRILIAMSKLASHRRISRLLGLVLLDRPFTAVLIFFRA